MWRAGACRRSEAASLVGIALLALEGDGAVGHSFGGGGALLLR